MNRVVMSLVRAATGTAFRSVEVRRSAPEPEGPVLVLANHGGGLGDILTVIAGCRRFPRFLARDVIWRFPIAKQVMDSVRAIPVSRRQDHGSGADNRGMFDAAFDGLTDGDLLAIYPEGDSIAEPRLAPLRTGAARILLGAWARGVDVTVEPMGLHYYDISVLRGRCLVQIGPPFQVSELVQQLPADVSLDESDREGVLALTNILGQRLNDVVEEYPDWQTRRQLEGAAAVYLAAADGGGVSYGDLALTADRLGRATAQEPVVTAYRDYTDQVELLGLKHGELPDIAMLGLQATNRMAELVALLPAACYGAVVNGVPMLGLRAISLSGVAPATAATLKPAFAMVAFPAVWVLLGHWGYRRGGVGGALLMAASGPGSLAATARVAEQGQLVLRIVRALRRSEGSVLERLTRARQELRTAVEQALAEVPA